ncbi:hypothetical protein HI914_07443 [Erysiphe necator]|uniref:F-box domain-containing protein n=1 Tax=Uncinula necator TaxID=52586 RepID=A0A0B1PFT2_UNCNE|nr:hypothetical protein HI914_07443 [Erysiphe necator]KHJ35439.1 hypothetical protein EV44_g6136 [Erysiphe necator]
MDDIRYPSPLAFDRVMEGMPISSYNSFLFNFPVEILTAIISELYSNKSDLASLALVNSDCRQLARSYQFCSVKFDGGRNLEGLLRLLQREAVERGQNRGRTRKPSLGACIRRVVTNNDGYWDEIMASRPLKSGRSIGDELDDPFDHDEEKVSQWRPIVGELTHKLNENYRPNVLFVVSSLVNLETFEISHADWNQVLLNTLVSLPIKNLSLGDVHMTDIIPVMDQVAWPIERLDIRLSWGIDFRTHTDKSSLNASQSWETILRSCAPSLQFLKICQSAIVFIADLLEEPILFVMKFPKLRQLSLLWETHFGPSALRSLMLTSSLLVTLAINYGDNETRKLLDRQGRIESLKVVILNHSYGAPIPESTKFRFLKKNLQLEAIGFYSAETKTLINRFLHLAKKFFQLKILSLTWEGFQVSESSLEALSKLPTLEALHLSSGCQIGWRNDWPVNHDVIKNSLIPLKKLKKIALTRDVYSYTRNGFTYEYNSYKELRFDAWNLHWESMREKALAYAEAFPNIELVHTGEITYEIFRQEKIIKLRAIDDRNFSWQRKIMNVHF